MNYLTRDIPKIHGFLPTLIMGAVATVLFFVLAAYGNPEGTLFTQLIGVVSFVVGFVSMVLLLKDLARPSRI